VVQLMEGSRKKVVPQFEFREIAGFSCHNDGMAKRPRNPNRLVKPMPIEESKIVKAGGRRVKMTYPGSEGTRHGILKSCEVACSGPGVMGGAWYCTVVDIFEFRDEPEPSLRFGYYLQAARATRPIWAGQTTYCGRLSEWAKILPAINRALKKAAQ